MTSSRIALRRATHCAVALAMMVGAGQAGADTGSATDALPSAGAKARACSDEALRRFAIGTSETAAQVAEAAWVFCKDNWLTVLGLMEASAAEKGQAGSIEGRAYFKSALYRNLHEGFLEKSTVRVMEIRSSSK